MRAITLDTMTIQAAADGSSLGNPGPAGWAWYVSEECWDAGGWPVGTNNIGELTAVLELLLATEASGLAGEELHVLTDSQYTINVITKWMAGWKQKGWRKADKKPIKNLELIQAIDRAIQGRAVRFTWVKGHAGHTMNEIVDERARACALAYQRHQPIPSGPGFRGSSTVVTTPRPASAQESQPEARAEDKPAEDLFSMLEGWE